MRISDFTRRHTTLMAGLLFGVLGVLTLNWANPVGVGSLFMSWLLLGIWGNDHLNKLSRVLASKALAG